MRRPKVLEVWSERLTPPVAVALLGLAVFLTRLPFLPATGFGQDNDGWRLYFAGRITVDSGQYVTSRPPGYPAMELLSTALARSGATWVVYTLLTAAASAVAVAAFADLLQTLQVKHWVLASVGLAFTPVVYLHSTTFMDYVWSLAALMVSFASLARGRLLAAGFAFALALAFRPATFVMVALIITLFLLRRCRLVDAVRFGVPVAVVSGAFYSLPLLNFGWPIVRAVRGEASLPLVFARSTVGVWGPGGLSRSRARWWSMSSYLTASAETPSRRAIAGPVGVLAILLFVVLPKTRGT